MEEQIKGKESVESGVNEEVLNTEGAENIDEKEINVNSLSDKEKKKLLKALLKENKELKQSCEEFKADAIKYKDSWYRTAADFENFKKRNQDTRMNAYKDGLTDMIKKVLVVGDNLDRAVKMDLDEKTKAGVQMTLKQFEETLLAEGVKVIDPLGEKFDPNTQEAVMAMPKEEGEESGTVKQVFLKGYMLGDKVIRYAQVVVIE